MNTVNKKNKPTLGSSELPSKMVDPLILVAGAAIAGAAVGSILPRSPAETRLLGATGAKLNRAAGSLAVTARKLVTAEVAAVPLIGDIAVEQIERVIDAVVEPAMPDPALTEA